MEILKIVIPKWNIAEITGYDPMTTFWQDFSMADKFGNEAIADTYRKVKAEWKDNYKHWTELCLVLNINLPGTILSRLAFHIILKS